MEKGRGEGWTVGRRGSCRNEAGNGKEKGEDKSLRKQLDRGGEGTENLGSHPRKPPLFIVMIFGRKFETFAKQCSLWGASTQWCLIPSKVMRLIKGPKFDTALALSGLIWISHSDDTNICDLYIFHQITRKYMYHYLVFEFHRLTSHVNFFRPVL